MMHYPGTRFPPIPTSFRHRVRSILCLPLINQARLIGVLYSKNNLTPHVFNPTRIAVLELLASQAAISLENASLYSDLQRSEAFLAQGQTLSHTAASAGAFSAEKSTGQRRPTKFSNTIE